MQTTATGRDGRRYLTPLSSMPARFIWSSLGSRHVRRQAPSRILPPGSRLRSGAPRLGLWSAAGASEVRDGERAQLGVKPAHRLGHAGPAVLGGPALRLRGQALLEDRKSTRLNS